MTALLNAILKIRKRSMMTRWHHLDSSKVMSTEPESVKKNTLNLSSRSKWFSAGLVLLFLHMQKNRLSHNAAHIVKLWFKMALNMVSTKTTELITITTLVSYLSFICYLGCTTKCYQM